MANSLEVEVLYPARRRRRISEAQGRRREAGSEGMAPTDALSTHPAFIENQAIIEELVAAHDPSGLSDSEYAVFEASKDWEGLAQELGFEVDHIVELEQTYRDKHQDLTLLHRIIRLGAGPD